MQIRGKVLVLFCSETDFIRYEANSFSNKQVIYGNNTTDPRLLTNAVSVMQCVFSLLGAMELALTCFIKAAFALEFALKRMCRLKFAFDSCEH